MSMTSWAGTSLQQQQSLDDYGRHACAGTIGADDDNGVHRGHRLEVQLMAASSWTATGGTARQHSGLNYATAKARHLQHSWGGGGFDRPCTTRSRPRARGHIFVAPRQRRRPTTTSRRPIRGSYDLDNIIGRRRGPQ